MDATLLQSKIYQGYSKAAKRLGYQCDVFRPAGTADPLASSNRIAGMLASFNANDMGYKRPNLYGDPTWFGLYDGTVTRTGDYVRRAFDQDVFFVGEQQPHLPIVMIECNRKLRVIRNALPAGVGAVSYGGECTGSASDVLGQAGAGTFGTGWPASILLGGRSENTGSGLPTTTKNAGWRILLPSSVPVVLNAGDIAIDDLGRRYAFQACELSSLGWRINATEEHA